jgi:CRISPR/Cas system endoribonuclease Cas6 (RAMP superfamily)
MVTLPPFKGPAFRGTLGFALRALVCPYDPSSPCADCADAISCPYAVMYDSLATGAERIGRFRDIPKPFVVVPPLTTKTAYASGDQTEFDVVLVGKAATLLPTIAAAFSLIGLRGFRDTDGRFRLDSISIVDRQQETAWCEHPEPDPAWFASRWLDADLVALPAQRFAEPTTGAPSNLAVSFVTPVRLRKAGRLLAESLPFDCLLERLCERTWLLGMLYCGVQMPDCNDLLCASRDVATTASDLTWFDMKRESIRSGRVDFGGLVGTVTYRGSLRPFLPFLEFGAVMGIGQGTTMGMGRYTMLLEQ